MSSERAFVVGNRPTDVRREWRWPAVQSVTALEVPVGVAIRSDATTADADVVGSEWSPYVAGSAPTPHDLVMRWLKVLAVFAAYHGHLDGWFDQLGEQA